MSFFNILFSIFIGPLELFFEFVYLKAYAIVDNPGIAIIVLSFVMNLLVLPLYRKADAMQENERIIENKLKDGVAHIKKTFKGDEKMMQLQTYYRQNSYSPLFILRGSVSLFLEIPFFIAAYKFLSSLDLLVGASFWKINNLGTPDQLLSIGDRKFNILPLIMTIINLISCILFTNGHPLKTKIQLYGMAIFFFFFLYNSPSGLVFYWTLNNVFSLIKTLFYKIKNSRQILTYICFSFGVILLAFLVSKLPSWGLRRILFFAILSIGFMCPLVLTFAQKKSKMNMTRIKGVFETLPHNNSLFWLCSLYCAVLIGVVIPSAVLSASPQEFADITYYFSPLWYIVSSMCSSVGTFLVWIPVFFFLSDFKGKKVFELGMFSYSVMGTVDYFLWGNKSGILSNKLKYENVFLFSKKSQIMNLFVLVFIFVVSLIVYRFFTKSVKYLVVVCCFAWVIMGTKNIITTQKSLDLLSDEIEKTKNSAPYFNLSKEGKNVIVLMLDRAMGEYVPYIMAEKPELLEQYDGFTYYSNALSFGINTNHAAAALFGGYEYTPEEMNNRADEKLENKHDEALCVLPALFSDADYEVTVFDPPYAGYTWIPTLSIYDDYKNVKAFNTSGFFENDELKKSSISKNLRNFFCFGLMKTLPISVQSVLYDDGNYNNSVSYSDMTSEGQTVIDQYRAQGIYDLFMKEYTVLQNMEEMTNISSENRNTFLMMANCTTHETMMLQEPEYIPALEVDNSEYEENNGGRFIIDGKQMKMETIDQITHYQSDMSAFIEVGKWLDYLREQGVYDNTRIIIASDHGRYLSHFEDSHIDSCNNSYEAFYPLLMVKDFNSKGFIQSDEFMTNADVPFLAIEGVLEDYSNPFTGNEISMDDKKDGVNIFFSMDWDVTTNNGNVFTEGEWYHVHDDIKNQDCWSLISRND